MRSDVSRSRPGELDRSHLGPDHRAFLTRGIGTEARGRTNSQGRPSPRHEVVGRHHRDLGRSVRAGSPFVAAAGLAQRREPAIWNAKSDESTPVRLAVEQGDRMSTTGLAGVHAFSICRPGRPFPHSG